jgi:hypothetical protein
MKCECCRKRKGGWKGGIYCAKCGPSEVAWATVQYQEIVRAANENKAKAH